MDELRRMNTYSFVSFFTEKNEVVMFLKPTISMIVLWCAGISDKWSTVCDGGVAIDVTGGCFAELSMGGERYTSVLQPGFNALKGKFETIQGVEVDIGAKGIDEVKLTCHGTKN